MANILLIEDNKDIQVIVDAALKREHTVAWASSLREAQSLLESGAKYDLVLLDLDLPDGSGLDFLSRFTQQFDEKGIGTIFLTGTNTVLTRTKGFSLGALDYISKPFDIVEFQVRVNSRLKKQERAAVHSILRRGNIQVDLVRQLAFEIHDENNRELSLTPVEFRLLTLFLQNDGDVVTRQKILDTVWGDSTHVSSRCVDHHVCGLRKKIQTTGQKIESIYGVGYRIETF